MSTETAIKISNVYKEFKLPHEKTGSLKSLFTGLFKEKKKGYERQQALKDISFEVKKGEFFGIVGRNGSGKSTLLKILAGIYQPTKGGVRVDGRLVPFIELGVGFNPELTGRENVYLNGALLGFSKPDIEKRYKDIVEFAELEKFMDQKLKNYSSGMQVRLAFSVATVLAESDILLIDEVLAVGDADFQRKCFEYFKQLKREDKTVIFVSHDMDAVREYCDRVVLIDQSKLIDSGRPDKIAAMYTALFTEDKVKIGETSPVWGNKKMRITDPKISITDNKITVKYTAVANDLVEGCIYGFAVKDMSGLQIISTNSNINGDENLSLDKGGSINITHSFDNILSDGSYTIDVALLGSDGITVYYWWQDAINMNIRKSRHTPSILDAPIKTTLEIA